MVAPGCKDLFDEIPVTWDDIWLWVETVVGLHRHTWRARHYVTAWNVVDKIRQEKLAGRWPPTHSEPYHCPYCGKRDTTLDDLRPIRLPRHDP